MEEKKTHFSKVGGKQTLLSTFSHQNEEGEARNLVPSQDARSLLSIFSLQPSISRLSPAPSMVDTDDNLDELEAEVKRLRVDNERLEREHKAAMLKAEIAQSRADLNAKQVATAELHIPNYLIYHLFNIFQTIVSSERLDSASRRE
jgi:hypothetical protein